MEITKFNIDDYIRIEGITKADCGGKVTPKMINGLEGQIIDYWRESDLFHIKITSRMWVACDKKFLRNK